MKRRSLRERFILFLWKSCGFCKICNGTTGNYLSFKPVGPRGGGLESRRRSCCQARVGAHARARVRATMCTAVSRSTFDWPCFVNLIDSPCCPGSTSTLPRRLGGASMMCSSASHDVQREPHGSVPAVGRCAATPSARPQATIKAL